MRLCSLCKEKTSKLTYGSNLTCNLLCFDSDPRRKKERIFHINCVVDQILKFFNVEFSYFWE